MQSIAEIQQFKQKLCFDVICDAYKINLGAILLQSQSKISVCTYFASRFLSIFDMNLVELNNSSLLGCVGIRKFVYGTDFPVASDHRALSTAVGGNQGSETYSSQSNKCVDRF